VRHGIGAHVLEKALDEDLNALLPGARLCGGIGLRLCRDSGLFSLLRLARLLVAAVRSGAAPLSPAALEVLAIIAYNQPVSRSFIEQVRGVDSSSTVSKLMERGLIEEAGRLDLPGKPVAFRVTDTFLRVFGLGSLADLPPLHDDPQKEEELPVQQTLEELQ